MNEGEKIFNYLKEDIDSLFVKLGKMNQNKKMSKEDYIKNGRQNLQSIDEFLYQEICIELQYCENKNRFNYLEISALSKILLDHLSKKRFPEEYSWMQKDLIVAILIKLGLSRFCKC